VQIGKGDLVLIQEDSFKRGLLKVGVVEDRIIERDGQVRGASVRKVAKGMPEFVKSPLQKFFPLESAARDPAKTEGKDRNKIRRNEVDKSRNDEETGRLEDERGSRSHSVRADLGMRARSLGSCLTSELVKEEGVSRNPSTSMR